MEAAAFGKRSHQRRPALAALVGVALSCTVGGGCSDEQPLSGERSLEECGSDLAMLQPPSADADPSYAQGYSQVLAIWAADTDICSFGTYSGECADGKRLLLRATGFTSEIRYYEGEAMVGVVSSTDVGSCPSVCPFSHYFGPAASVRCEEPLLTELCPGSVLGSLGRDPRLPFADGTPPGGCSD